MYICIKYMCMYDVILDPSVYVPSTLYPRLGIYNADRIVTYLTQQLLSNNLRVWRRSFRQWSSFSFVVRW